MSDTERPRVIRDFAVLSLLVNHSISEGNQLCWYLFFGTTATETLLLCRHHDQQYFVAATVSSVLLVFDFHFPLRIGGEGGILMMRLSW